MTHVFLDPNIVLTAGFIVAVVVITGAALRAWQGWLELKRSEISYMPAGKPSEEGSGIGTARIELADLKERIRKLEAIASGVEL